MAELPSRDDVLGRARVLKGPFTLAALERELQPFCVESVEEPRLLGPRMLWISVGSLSSSLLRWEKRQ